MKYFIRYLFFTISILHFFTFMSQVSDNSTLFVSTGGDDNNIGSFSNPLKTLKYAIEESNPGDTIYLRSGTYYELIKISEYGLNQNKWLTIRPYKNEQVIRWV